MSPPSTTHMDAPGRDASAVAWWARPLRLPFWWLGFTAVGVLDLALTHLVLSLNGHEVNPLARLVLESAGFHGLVAFKFALVVVVVMLAEFIAAHALPTAKKLAVASVAISAFPVVWTTLMVSQLILRG